MPPVDDTDTERREELQPGPLEAPGGLVGRFVRNLGYVEKWLLLGIIIGVIAGLGAVVFYLAMHYTGDFLLGDLAGYRMPTPKVEGNSAGVPHYLRPWALPLLTTAGALVSALIVARFAPEASGHGTDSAIEAIHTDPRHIRLRVVLVKMVSSALTIGSGGFGGREGPTAQISAGFASMLTRRLHLSDEDGRILVSLGVGAIIAVGIASLLLYHTKVSIYHAQRLNRETAEAEREMAAAGHSDQRPPSLTGNEIQFRAELAASFSVEVPSCVS